MPPLHLTKVALHSHTYLSLWSFHCPLVSKSSLVSLHLRKYVDASFLILCVSNGQWIPILLPTNVSVTLNIVPPMIS